MICSQEYENLKLHSSQYGVPHFRENWIAGVIEVVGLTEGKDDQVKKYSGVMCKRLEIARSLIHNRK